MTPTNTALLEAWAHDLPLERRPNALPDEREVELANESGQAAVVRLFRERLAGVTEAHQELVVPNDADHLQRDAA